jgi:hypothetical protein
MNGEIRDREKTMRGLKRKHTPIISGYQIYHNYIRQHEGLDGKTPSEAFGIRVEGKINGCRLFRMLVDRTVLCNKRSPFNFVITF